jgi:hypothetical protein
MVPIKDMENLLRVLIQFDSVAKQAGQDSH